MNVYQWFRLKPLSIYSREATMNSCDLKSAEMYWQLTILHCIVISLFFSPTRLLSQFLGLTDMGSISTELHCNSKRELSSMLVIRMVVVSAASEIVDQVILRNFETFPEDYLINYFRYRWIFAFMTMERRPPIKARLKGSGANFAQWEGIQPN